MKRYALVVLLSVLACEEGSGSKGAESAAAAPKPAVEATSASVTKPAMAAPVADPPAYSQKELAAGVGEDGVWTAKFKVARDRGNAGLGFEAAQQHCVDAGRSLCTETQWARACEADPELGKLETWTATYGGDGRFVVRGGGGCGKRDVVPGAEASGSRVAVCCSRVVGIDSETDNAAFRIASAKKIADYEAALRRGSRALIADAYADDVSFLGRRFDKAALMREYDKDMKRFPKQWTLFDTCKVSLGEDAEGKVTRNSDCKTVLRRGSKIYGAAIRFVHGGEGGKIVQVGFKATGGALRSASADGEPAETGEEKEGFGFLMQAEE